MDNEGIPPNDPYLSKTPKNPSKWRRQTSAIRKRKSKIMLYIMEHMYTTVNQIKEKKNFAGSKKDIERDCFELKDCGAVKVLDISPQLKLLVVYPLTERQLVSILNPFAGNHLLSVKFYAANRELQDLIEQNQKELLKVPQVRDWLDYKTSSKKILKKGMPDLDKALLKPEDTMEDIIGKYFELNQLNKKFLEAIVIRAEYNVFSPSQQKMILDGITHDQAAFLKTFYEVLRFYLDGEDLSIFYTVHELIRKLVNRMAKISRYHYGLLVGRRYNLHYRLEVLDMVLDAGITYAKEKLGFKTNDSVIEIIKPLVDQYRNPDFDAIAKIKSIEAAYPKLVEPTDDILKQITEKHKLRAFFKKHGRKHPDYKKMRRQARKYPDFVIEV